MPKQISRKFRALESKVLFIVAVLVVTVAASASVAYASVYFISESPSGETFWLSCGSSAGNYVALCPAGGGACTVDQGFAQEEANRLCGERGHPATEQNNY